MIIAHQVEAMARQKRLHSPEHYLKRQRRRASPHEVAVALQRMQKRGLNVTVRRIEQKKEQP